MFLRQTWTLTKKDLLILLQRRWLSTSIRALIFPIVFTLILAYIKIWTEIPGQYGIGNPTPLKSFSDALAETGNARHRVVIVDNGFTDGDIGSVVNTLSSTIRSSGKELHVIPDVAELLSLCPSSNSGVTECYGAVQFLSAPDHGSGATWNYTMYADGALGGTTYVDRTNNDLQIYTLPFQHAIDSAIASVRGGPGLRSDILQYPFTYETEAEKESISLQSYEGDVQAYLAFAFFVGLSGLTYHAVGHITQQREQGILQLIDAMMPNDRRWERIAARVISTHVAFDLIYLPGWIVMGVILSAITFPQTNTGYLILLNLLTGLALTSYSILASSLFKRSQLSAISAIVAALVFAIVAQFGEGINAYANMAGVIATSVLFPPCAYVYFLLVTASFEQTGQALPLNQPSSDTTWKVTAATFLGLLALQIVLFPFIGAVIETKLHGTASKLRKIRPSDEMSGQAVRLQDFSKHYKSRTTKKQMVKAVDHLALSLRAGSITALLGANGSGKTTTLNAIAGIETITGGSIELDGTGSLGLCPQKNVMWDDLTVQEHVEIFERLKRPVAKSREARKVEVQRIIEGCDLHIKRSAQAKTLSGGQKRKLQLAMMLAGGSTVCCIDEATSGIDPLARRSIWDILLAERGSRTLLLTTHFLDEAEVLADHVAILSKGILKAQGSVASLKTQLGDGYQIILENADASQIPAAPQLRRHLDYDHTVFDVADSSALAYFVAMLERKGIQNYRLQGPTIENVFLKLAEEMHRDPDSAQKPGLVNETFTKVETGAPERPTGLVLNTGIGCGPLKQTGILFQKRLTILKHNYMPYVAALFVSLVVAGMVTRFFIGYNFELGTPCVGPGDPSAELQSFTYGLYSYDLTYGQFVYGPPDRLSVSTLQRFVPVYTEDDYSSSTDWNGIPTAGTLTEFNEYISHHTDRVGFGGFFNDAQSPTFAWSSTLGAIYPMLLQSLVDQVLMNQTINFGYQSFQESFTPSNSVTSLVAVITTLGFAIYPALFALYPTGERIRQVRAMHYSNGILPSSLWLAYLLFDTMFVILISVLTVAIWASQWTGWYALGYMFVVFFLYGLASTAFSYVVSLFVASQLAAIAFAAVIQVIISMLYFVAYVVSASSAPADKVYTWFNYITYTIGLISPASNLLRGLFITLNQYSLVCRGSSKASYPGEISLYGGPILYLIIQFVVLAAFLMFWESGRSLEVFGIRRRHSRAIRECDQEKSAHSHNSETDEDPARLAPSNNGLSVSHISKSFGSNLAVDDVTFSVLPSEKFALLGPNGAGKSTMISLIRGDLRQDHGSDGSIYIAGDSLEHSPVAAKNHLGVCPQFDATDSMTLFEHLDFYARARGVPNRAANISELIRRLNLQDHAKKLVSKLSGGTHRKLSLAIALIGNPRVLLLDEPSSGMDPAAKRALWSTLSTIAEGRVLLLTTHSMEEAGALCDRAGIMAGRLLALGSVDELRARYGGAAWVHLVHKDAPDTSVQDMERVRQEVYRRFPGAQIEQRTFGGQLRFNVPEDGRIGVEVPGSMRIGRLFQIVEEMKEEWGITDYAIGPATLDQVFLNVVGRHNVQEENTEVEKRKGRWSAARLLGK